MVEEKRVHFLLVAWHVIGRVQEATEVVELVRREGQEVFVGRLHALDLQPLPVGPEIEQLVPETVGVVLAQAGDPEEERADAELAQARLEVRRDHLRNTNCYRNKELNEQEHTPVSSVPAKRARSRGAGRTGSPRARPGPCP